jgi:PAS domain S-box-containing protein
VGLRRTRLRRQAKPFSRRPEIGGLGTPGSADDPGELVIRTTPDGRYTYVSPAVRRILGYEPDQLLAQAPFETVHPDDLTLVGSAGDRLAAGSDQESVLLRKRHADGHDVWLDARIATVRDPATAEVVEIRATARDVTTQVVTERALRQRVGAESLIGDVSRRLLTATAEEIDEVVAGSLERAARFVGAERATLALLSDDGEAAIRTHQWAVDSDFESIETLVPVTTMPWLIEQCRRGELVFARSLDDLPDAARVERGLFERNGVRSVACAPITQVTTSRVASRSAGAHVSPTTARRRSPRSVYSPTCWWWRWIDGTPNGQWPARKLGSDPWCRARRTSYWSRIGKASCTSPARRRASSGTPIAPSSVARSSRSSIQTTSIASRIGSCVP